MKQEVVAAAIALLCCSLAGCVNARRKPDFEKSPPPLPRERAPITIDPSKTSIEISIKEQKLFLLHNDVIIRAYDVSTALRGVGNRARSEKTPLGLHRIYKKIGHGEPIGRVFRWAMPQNHIASIRQAPPLPDAPRYITTRILWLEGLKKGNNHTEAVDSRKRHIYIHGTNQEGAIGAPDSKGCIFMRNTDIVELFDVVQEGTKVKIVLGY